MPLPLSTSHFFCTLLHPPGWTCHGGWQRQRLCPLCVWLCLEVLIIILTNVAESQRGGAGRTTNDTSTTPHTVLSCISQLLGSWIELKLLELAHVARLQTQFESWLK